MKKWSQYVLAALPSVFGQTVHLAGDSTMVDALSQNGQQQGWGAFLPNYISLAVENAAIAGRSARSFTREGRFTAMAASVRSGDYVVIEFGHNDGGSLSTDNGRTDCNPVNGDYSVTCQTTYNGVAETVQTYHTYLVSAAKLFQGKGANVIISSPTPNNVWQGGSYAHTPTRFVTYAQDAAKAVGATFVDHQEHTATLYNRAGSATVNSYYPIDNTHTNPAGANVVARAFILALQATSNSLKNYITHD